MRSFSQSLKAIRTILLVLAIMNVLAFLAINTYEGKDPTKNYLLVPREDALVLISRTKLGTYHYKIISDWLTLEKFMSANHLRFLEINDATSTPNLSAKLVGKKIIWGTTINPNIMVTPDYLCALKIYPFVRFGAIKGSVLGHSIELISVDSGLANL